MEKSNHNYNEFCGGEIPYEELRSFIYPITMNIDIPFYYMEQLCYKNREKAMNYLYSISNEMLHNLPKLKLEIDETKEFLFCTTYMPHVDGYDFRINPISFVNKIFEKLQLKYIIPFINLDTKEGMNYFKDYVRSYIQDVKRVVTDEKILEIMDELNININYICSIYDIKLDNNLKNYILPKDMLVYLAYSSMALYEETRDPKYLYFAYEYYHNVSHMKTSPYPYNVFHPSAYKKVNFGDFKKIYENEVGTEYVPDETKYRITNSDIYLAWEILSTGTIERELRDIMQRAKSYSNIDYEKFQRLYEMKINYYMNSDYQKCIRGLYVLSGYIGFYYPNEYLVFDKFYNSSTKYQSKRTMVTTEAAIYALPSDRFSIITGDKQSILKERQEDNRIVKINHTDTFIDRLDKVVNGPNLSLSILEDELEILKKRMLIR